MSAHTRTFVSACALALALAIVACGKDSPTQPASSPGAPIPARGRLDGQYTLTIEANCKPGQWAVPEPIRRRTYDATLEQNESDLTLKIAGPDVRIANGHGEAILGNVSVNNIVVFGFGDFFYNYVFYGPVTATGLVERLSPTIELIISGVVNAKATSTSIVGLLRGIFLQREGFYETALCNADHTFEMRRR